MCCVEMERMFQKVLSRDVFDICVTFVVCFCIGLRGGKASGSHGVSMVYSMVVW